MKTEINFNHNADHLTDALGVQENVAEAVNKAIKDYMVDDRTGLSVLSEYLGKNLDYPAILMFATKEVKNKIMGGGSELKGLMSLLELMSGMIEDDEDKEDEEQEGKEPKISLN